jgi:organic hydroperoxide reductase OsmC/OhrA
MLWFLSIAARQGFVVENYRDAATGEMGKNDDGRLAMIRVILHPEVSFCGPKRPTESQLSAMHDEAHERCFIANSVKTEVRCQPLEASA